MFIVTLPSEKSSSPKIRIKLHVIYKIRIKLHVIYKIRIKLHVIYKIF